MPKKRTKTKSKKIKTKNNNVNKFFFFIAIVCFIFILDRYTKYLSSFIQACFIFCIKQSINYGAAFSLLNNFGWTRILLITIAVFVMFFAAFFYFQNKKFTLIDFGLSLLFAGTLSNVFDRIYYGYVIDFIGFAFWPAFPAFNLADIANLVGVIILIWAIIKKP